jgi:Ser/Thr protein kinase RdoA (MazF antagonist)
MVWAALTPLIAGLLPRRSALAPGFAAQLMTELFPNQARRQPGDVRVRELASLYSGLGSVFLLDDAVVLKQIKFPRKRGFEEQRDMDSYFVEAAFYSNHAEALLAPPHSLELPRPFRVSSSKDGVTLAISKLSGDPMRSGAAFEQAAASLEWLAGLHAAYWGVDESQLNGLHRHGTFWTLDMRLDELSKMPTHGWEGRLYLAARAIDERLKADAMQTCVHGDPKPANMFFRKVPGPDGGSYSAQVFDYQYIGRAPPSKDLAYVFTCVTGAKPGAAEDALLVHYHEALSERLAARGIAAPPLSHFQESLELAFADLARWMSGWGWWGRDGLTVRSLRVLDALDGGRELEDEDAYRDAMRAMRPA